MSSSVAVNALVNSGSSGYRCRSRRTFGCLFGALPLSRSNTVGVPLGSTTILLQHPAIRLVAKMMSGLYSRRHRPLLKELGSLGS